MTDKEVIKALECCKEGKHCGECPYMFKKQYCFDCLSADALDLINRQQAEIEWLLQKLQQPRAEAIKEFAERLKENCKVLGAPLITNRIDNLVKEMVGEDK